MKKIISLSLLSLQVLAVPVCAQAAVQTGAAAANAMATIDAMAPAQAAQQARAAQNAAKLTPEEMKQTFRGSFFFSPLEVAAIDDALNGRVASSATMGAENKAIPPHRVIRVGGVLYRTPSDWVVWMNNKKVTPSDLLPEILDISVHDTSKVSLKWYDVGLNKVILITMRPHQVYDITTGVLLPGVQR